MSQVLGKTGDIYIFRRLSSKFNSTSQAISEAFWHCMLACAMGGCVVLCQCVRVRVCNYQCVGIWWDAY